MDKTIDQLTEMVANLAARVANLERRVAELEPNNNPKVKTRKDIILQARRDIEELKKKDRSYGEYSRNLYGLNAEFIINRDKRTIVCLLRGYESGDVIFRGIAKCHPNDVFNADIGKAIALRRALDLLVPAEYLNAPPPEDVAEGDVITVRVDEDYAWHTFVARESLVAHLNEKLAEGNLQVIDDTDREDYRERPGLGEVIE